MSVASYSQPPPAPDRRYYRRATVARRLKVSVSTIRLWESKGEITPIKGEDGWRVYFDPDDVDRLEEKHPPEKRKKPLEPEVVLVGGKNAAHVFAMLKAKRSFHDIVIETCLEPWRVREIEREYKLGGLEGAEKAKAQARAAADARKSQKAHENEMRLESREQMKAATKAELARKLLRAGVAPEAVGQVIAAPAPFRDPTPVKKKETP